MNESEEILNKMKERYKLALFMVIRNFKVLPTGMKLGKSNKEINQMSYETLCEILTMIDYDKARVLYEEGRQSLLDEGKGKNIEE